MIIGYKRVSTLKQVDGNSLEEQEKVILERYPQANIYSEAYSGAKERKVFNEVLHKLEKGDTLVVTKLDRFCRTTKEGLGYIDMLMSKGVRIHILNMGLIEDTPMGRLIVTNLLAFAEFERAMIVERTQGGKAIARQKQGYREGRPSKDIDHKTFQNIYALQKQRELSIKEACEKLGIGRTKWYELAREL